MSVCLCVHTYVRTSIRPKSFFDFNDIWHVGMQYNTIQGQGHETLKVGNSAIFNGYLLPNNDEAGK